jgi:hypothetical protein
VREETFWRKVEKTDGCWLWKGRKLLSGYGTIQIMYKSVYAHRYVLGLVGVDVPADAVVCHRCDNPSCVRPDHLFVGDQKANMRDAAAKGRMNNGRRSMTKCHNGHPLSGDNLMLVQRGDRTERHCRECRRARFREWYRRNKTAVYAIDGADQKKEAK